MLQKHQPIGIFDSGIGGLTVANAILAHLPQEEIIYFGDTAHLPYGDKSADAIRYYCLKIAKFLMEKDCKMIVVACNSASSVGYEVLLEFFQEQLLFANVVDPLVEVALSVPYQKIGIIATKATINSGVYQAKLKQEGAHLSVAAMATPLLAPMIEEGFVHNRISDVVLDTYLGSPDFKDIDALLLACTHYPLIKPDIEQYFKHRVKVYDSGALVARQVAQQLQAHHLLNEQSTPPQHKFYISDYTRSFEETARRFYTHRIDLEYCNIW
ncbi:MAG TPA: glutamate racemase [Saprospiraceae bacterium]|nr:glutamate racemase [Saprospiraceae bacterium]